MNKTDPIQSLNEALKKSLSEIVKLKRDYNDQLEKTNRLYREKTRLSSDILKQKQEFEKFKNTIEELNKEIVILQEEIKKLKKENSGLMAKSKKTTK